jgi:hypothetical protein
MALADTTRAIGAVSSALKERIDAITTITTFVGRPSETSNTNPHLNLFLYEISFDPHLKNTPLNEGEKPPLWIVLKYLLTAFESATDSDSERAHLHLGAALRAVYTDDLLKMEGLSPAIIEALSPNPSPLHVTFDESPPDLLAKLMQGPDDKVRLSACFQVRPVMIAAAEPGDFSLLVGVDYTKSPVRPADPYVGLDLIPSMGAHIDEISPVGFEVGEEVTLKGDDLHLSGLSVMLGPVELPVTMQRPEELRFRVDPAIIAGSSVSAGSYPVAVVQNLTGTGKKRKSNAVIGNLVPTLDSVTVAAAVIDDPGPPIRSHRVFNLSGALLGLDTDDAIIAFYRDGRVHKMLDVFELLPALPGQPGRQIVVKSDDRVAAGVYNIILIVNGQQAPQSPSITLTWP